MTKEKSLVKNYAFNLIKTFSSLCFPLITFTYSARILGEDGVGQVNFTKSVVSYFTMLAMLGMNYYGTREGAKLRDDRDALSKFSHEMLFINGCMTLISYALLFAAIAAVPKFRGYETLLMVTGIEIALQGFGMEWLYQALEEYRYITIRLLGFQVIALAVMLLFVREPGDVVPYAAVSLLATSGSYVMNFINARKYIRFRFYGNYEIKKHVKPVLWLFAMAVSIEFYTVLDSTMLGFLQGDAAVGRYTVAIKANKLVNRLITAVGVVLIPRLAYHIGQGEMSKVKELVAKSYNYVFMMSIPAAVGLSLLSDEVVKLLGGSGFASASFTMRLLAPIVLVIPFSVVTNQQTFVPMGKEKMILFSTLTGAVVNFLFNSLLIPRYAENGAAVATVLAETAVMIVCFCNAGRFFDMRQILSKYWQYWVAAIPIPLVVRLVSALRLRDLAYLPLTAALSAFGYFLILYILKNPYLLEAMRTVGDQIHALRKGKKE